MGRPEGGRGNLTEVGLAPGLLNLMARQTMAD